MTVHRWISTDGDFGAAASWDSGEAPSVAATGVLTLSGNALDLETVTLDTKVYTFDDTDLDDVDGHVLIGADASESIDNLVAAITLGAGAGTKYAASTTLHPTVTAVAGAGDTMDVTAKTKGTGGNSIATTETLTNGSFGGATLSGGTQWAATDEAWLDGILSQVSLGIGMDQSPVTIAGLFIERAFTGNIGSSASPLKFLSVVGGITHRGAGCLYYESQNTTRHEGVIVDSLNSGLAAQLSAAANSGYIDVLVKQGTVIITATALFDVDYGTVATLGNYADLTILGASGGATYNAPRVFCTHGTLRLGQRDFDLTYNPFILLSDGLLELRNVEGMFTFMQTGGRSRWALDVDMGAETNHCFLLDGTIDMRLSQYAYEGNVGIIAPDMNIVPGAVMTEDILKTNMTDLRGDYP